MDDVEALSHHEINYFFARLKSRIPSLPLIRTILKASVAVTISLIFVLVDSTRHAIGPASTLATLSTLLYFPVKPIAIHMKIALQGTLSAAIGGTWCLLGNYLANLARDPAVASPIQPGACAVSGIFCSILIFVIAYVRSRYPQMAFATVFAGMIGSFALTQNVATPGFKPSITINFMMPVLFGTAISLMVNLFLWPEDAFSSHIEVLSKTLAEYSAFFEESTVSYLDQQPNTTTSFTQLRTRLQSKLIHLVDSQHTVEYVVLFSRLSQKDLHQITHRVKEMRTPLHGIGVGLICRQKKNYHEKLDSELDKATQDLITACSAAMQECIQRLDGFRISPRSVYSTIFWPFPRLFVSTRPKPKAYTMSFEKMENVIAQYEKETKKWRNKTEMKDKVIKQVDYLFQFNLLGYANSIQSLVSLVESLDVTRPNKRRLWFPSVSIKKWFQPSVSNKSQWGQQVNPQISLTESIGSSIQKEQEEEMFLTRTERVCPRDPDVDAPVTRRERFFHMIYRIMDGFYSIEAVFAFKTTTGFMLLSLPAYLPQSVGWFTGWGGQWVANTLLMWMFPMAGMFNFTIILGLMGSVSGCILSIVLWEIVRGNPYGIAALSFLTITSFQYLFFTSQIYSYLSVMTLYTYLMVTTTGYQTAVGGALENDIIELAAGKRMVFVVLGIICSFLVNLVPRPVTGRVELRKRVANTFKDLATLYGIIFADILIDRPGTPYPSLNQVKAFRQLALHIQRQLKDQETYLRLSKLEPPLRGQFPFATYQSLIEKLNNMADLVEGMAYTARSLDKTWKRPLIAVLDQGKFDYVACLLTVMRQLSATMISKMPLPPYMISPDDLKHQFSENLCRVISEYPEQVHNDTFPSYCAYSVASYTFTQELNDAAACIENLVGVENPQQWLYMHI